MFDSIHELPTTGRSKSPYGRTTPTRRLLLVMSLSLIALASTVSAARAGLTPAQIRQVLDEHNRVRREAARQYRTQIPDVVWDARIAQFAQQWADHLAARDIFQHRQGNPYGENLAWSSGFFDPRGAVRLWESEKAKYKGETITNTNYRIFGHYTQMIWDKSTRVGCGLARSRSGRTYIVCNYALAGNVIGQKPFRVGNVAPPPPIREDLVDMDWRNAQVRRVGQHWKIVKQGRWYLDFGSNKAEADRALQIIKFYRLTQHGFVGRPNPSFEYWLSGGRSPRGPMPGEDCLRFDPNSLKAVPLRGNWSLLDGNHVLLAFGNKQNEALEALRIIRKYQFRYICFVGRPGPSFVYFRQ